MPRDQAVTRALSQLRTQLLDKETNLLQAADGIVAVVADFGLRPVEPPSPPDQPLTPDQVGVVVYQVVLLRA